MAKKHELTRKINSNVKSQSASLLHKPVLVVCFLLAGVCNTPLLSQFLISYFPSIACHKTIAKETITFKLLLTPHMGISII